MDTEKVLQYLLYGALGAVLFVVPFLITGSMFFPFITGKNIVFRLAVEIGAGAWLLLALRNPLYRPKRSLILYVVLAFVVVIGVANMFGVGFSESFWSDFERMEGYVTILHFALYILVVGTVLQTQGLWQRALHTTVIASVVMACYGLLQLTGTLAQTGLGANRIAGAFGNATYLAVYMLFHVFLTLLLFVQYKKRDSVRWLYIVAIALQIFILAETATRGAMLGLFGGLVLTALLVALFEHTEHTYRRIGRITLVVLVVFGGLFFVARNTALVQNVEPLRRVANISFEETTVRSRLTLWGGIAVDGFKERPLLGWGQEGFNAVFAKYYDPRMYDQEPWFDRAHNVVFDWLIAGGVLGLAAYLLLFVVTLYYVWFRSSGVPVVEKSILTGLLAGYFFHNLFVFDNIVSYILFGTVIAYAHARSVYADTSTDERVLQKKRGGFYYSGVVAVFLLVVASAYTFAIRPALGARSLLQSISPQGTLSDNLAFFEKAISYSPPGGKEISLQLFQMTGGVIARSDLDDEIKQAFATRAIEEGRRQADELKSSARHDLFFGIFLMRLGLLDEAGMYLERARAASPDKQHILETLAQYYFTVGNTEEGLAALLHAYEVAPQFKGPAAVYAAGLIRTGNIREAELFLLEAFGTTTVTHSSVINAYVSVGDLKKVHDLWDARLVEDPNDSAAHLSLAGVLAEEGSITDALLHIERALSLNPNLKPQADHLLNQMTEAGLLP